MQGRVKFFNVERGYGFVHNEAGSWWFHRSYCRGDAPAAGDTVEFWLDDGTRGVEVKPGRQAGDLPPDLPAGNCRNKNEVMINATRARRLPHFTPSDAQPKLRSCGRRGYGKVPAVDKKARPTESRARKKPC